MNLHRCRAVGCQATVKTTFLMCLDHWRLVPKAQRDQVLATNRAVRDDVKQRIGDRATHDAYRAAVQAAVDAVRDKQTQRRAKADAQTPPLF